MVTDSCIKQAVAWPVNVYLSLIYWICKNASPSELTLKAPRAVL